jgi:hypothetical protein
MKRQISFSQYRTIDLCILSVVLVVCQYLTHLAVSFWFPEQLYVVSPVAGMTALVMMRWSIWAAVPAGLGGIMYVWMSGGSLQQMLIYVLGNGASLAALLMFQMFGKERIRKDSFLAVAFAIAVQLLMQLGRAAVAAVFGYSAAACLGFITTDLLSILFTVFIIWTVRRIEGLFEDQKNYLLRIQREQQVERGEQF